MKFPALDNDKTRCRACDLWKQGGSVLSVGNRCRPLMMVIGEAPGEQEIMWMSPFVGPAGKILRKAIAAAGFKANDVLYSNLLGCRPPNDAFPEDQQQVQYCVDTFLMREIALSQPVVLLLAGAKPLFYLMGMQGITKNRGQWHKGPHDLPTITTFHPSYILRGAGEEVERLFLEDICSAYKRATTGTA